MVAPDPDLPPSTPRGKEEKPMSAVEAALRYLAQIQDVMPRLCSNADISVAFLRSTFFEEYTRALHSWLVKKARRTEGDGDEWKHGFGLMEHTSKAVQVQALKHGDLHWKLGEAYLQMVRGGFIELAVEGMHSILARSGHADTIRDVLLSMQDQLLSRPAVVDAVLTEVTRLLGPAFWSTRTFAHMGWTTRWEAASLDFLAAHITNSQKRSYALIHPKSGIGNPYASFMFIVLPTGRF
ncbi:hypothetical protein FA13DRAFT_1137061 [Coprinellus micaceus]|uniref:Uncharacterized protein n=1 Tax=Coprinellus micaceus TaxID=71717 RepID=A0A4Y7RIQ9_COPMI|nr:hypothetical protein FA13DRAFT_1137061 [Coprinellus micaceus]